MDNEELEKILKETAEFGMLNEIIDDYYFDEKTGNDRESILVTLRDLVDEIRTWRLM